MNNFTSLLMLVVNMFFKLQDAQRCREDDFPLSLPAPMPIPVPAPTLPADPLTMEMNQELEAEIILLR